MPDISFLDGGKADQLKVVSEADLTKLRIAQADVVVHKGSIARVSLYDRPEVAGRVLFPPDAKVYSRLYVLIAVNCAIKQEIPAYFSDLPSIEHVDISNNPITANFEEIDPPPKLKFLRVTNTQIQGSADKFLSKGKLIEQFDITNTKATLSPSVICAAMPSLKKAGFSLSSISAHDQEWENKISEKFQVKKWPNQKEGESESVVIIRRGSDDPIEGRPKEEVIKELELRFRDDHEESSQK